MMNLKKYLMNQKRKVLYDEILHIRNISNPGTVISNNKTAAGWSADLLEIKKVLTL